MSASTRPHGFLAELEASLEGGKRHRREIVTELAAHFQDLIEAEAPSGRAVSRALERFGSPTAIADEFNAIRRARLRRRTRAGVLLALVVALLGAPSVMTTAAPRGQLISLAESSGNLHTAHARLFVVAIDPKSGRVIALSRGRRI